MRSRVAALAGSFLFLIVAPGTVAGYLPWLIGRWRFDQDFGASSIGRALGAMLLLLGLAGLLECFVRFAIKGLGTPAPLAPTRQLIVTGLYRYVRNPMYVSVVAAIVGQALLFGQVRLLGYAAIVWLAFFGFVLAYEEPTLERQFPDDYERYRRAVPRWLPRLTPWTGR
jgi:protein-S-isoprenylcysteine O-methyltransferase Ste14